MVPASDDHFLPLDNDWRDISVGRHTLLSLRPASDLANGRKPSVNT